MKKVFKKNKKKEKKRQKANTEWKEGSDNEADDLFYEWADRRKG